MESFLAVFNLLFLLDQRLDIAAAELDQIQREITDTEKKSERMIDTLRVSI